MLAAVPTARFGQQRYTEAAEAQQMAVNATHDPRERGWLKPDAVRQQLLARKLNGRSALEAYARPALAPG